MTKARDRGAAAHGPVPSRRRPRTCSRRRSGGCSRSPRQYPELRATENFQQLQAQLEETEDKIAVSRQVYNDAVLTYDNALETVPTNIVAGIFSFEPREYFEIEEPAAREAPQVRF